MTKMVSWEGNITKFNLWDSGGQEKFHSLARMYYRDAAAALLVFDITSLASFHCAKRWFGELEEHGPEEVAVILVGNKVDLAHKRQVEVEDAKEFARTIRAFYVETSAKDDTNVSKAFLQIAKRLPVLPVEGGGVGGAGEEAAEDTIRIDAIDREPGSSPLAGGAKTGGARGGGSRGQGGASGGCC